MEYVTKRLENEKHVLELSVVPGLCFSTPQNDLYVIRLLYKYDNGTATIEKQYTTTDKRKAVSAFNRYKRGVIW